MKRRMFVTGALAAGAGLGRVAAQGLPKPAAEDAPLSEPIALVNGLRLVDYRFVADNFKVSFLGEIEHVGEEAFDGQALSATFLDDAGEAIETIYPIPLVPVIEPGMRLPVYSSFREFNPLEDAWNEMTVAICGEHPLFEYTEQLAQLDLTIEELAEEREAGAYLAEGVIRNGGEVEAEPVEVHAIFRDAGGRLAGFSREWLDDPIPAGGGAAFAIEASRETIADPVLDPFARIDGEYTVELVVCIGRPSGYAIAC